MLKLRPIVAYIVGAGLLQACVAARQELAMQPVLQVRHSSDQTAATYYQLGQYHQERGNLELAVTAYTHSIALDGRQLEPRNALAAVLARQGRLAEATAVLLQLVATYPNLAPPYNNLGYVYFMQGNYDAAVRTLQHALVLDAGNERARNNLDAAQAALAQQASADGQGRTAPSASGSTALPAPASREQKEEAMTANTSSPTTEPAAPAVPPPPSEGLASIIPERVPEERMELVPIRPNLYELKRKPVAALPPQRLAEPTLASAAAPASGKMPHVEIANGNGIPGMAKRMRHLLGLDGIAVARLTNERPYRLQETKIQYRAGFEQEAKALKDALKGRALMVPANLSSSSDIRLVLGRDAVLPLALIDGAGHPPLPLGT